MSGLKVVSIGGGTGLSTLLSGLKKYVRNEGSEGNCIERLTAVVTVTDDGGSSGRLREEFQILAPGDIRNCIVALAEDEHLLTRLLRYRFESNGELSGHSFGNLLLTALTNITGDFLDAIKVTCEVLAIKGRIFPATMENASLVAELADGRLIKGESKITAARSQIKKLTLLPAHSQPLPETLQAIREADIITLGPGSLYTSIIPNLLVDGLVEEICNASAAKIYICNIMTQPGETEGFDGEAHLDTLFSYSPPLKLDYVLVNSTPISAESREKYLADGSVQVEFKASDFGECNGACQTLNGKGSDQNLFSTRAENVAPLAPLVGKPPSRFRIVRGDLLCERDVVRHDPHKLAQMVVALGSRESGAWSLESPESLESGVWSLESA